MAITDKSQCAPCCKSPGSCTGCAKCLPRYLCVHAIVTPPPYDDSECRCSEIHGRIVSDGCGWSGVVQCGTDSLTVSVEVVRSGDTCKTVVDIPELSPYSFEFPGVLQNISISVEDDDGVEFAITIESANVVTNPQALDPCPLCKCATCIPASFCLRFVTVDGETITDYADWNATTCRWGPATIHVDPYTEIEVTARMATAVDGIGCAIIVTANESTGYFVLESSAEGSGYNGIECIEQGATVRRGVGPNYREITYDTMVDLSLDVLDGYDAIGTLYVSDRSCGGQCEQPCALTCCLNPWPLTIYAEYQNTSETTVPLSDIVPMHWGAGPFANTGSGAGYFGRLTKFNSFLGVDQDVDFLIGCDSPSSTGLTFQTRISLAGTHTTSSIDGYVDLFSGSITHSADCRPIPDPLPEDHGLVCCLPPLIWLPSPAVFYERVAVTA